MSNNLSPTGTEQAVCNDIAARQRLGIQKYGTTVAGNPLSLREWLQHAYEEALDQAIYLKRAISEVETPQNKHLRAENDLTTCGVICEGRHDETIVGSVLRVVQERDCLKRRIASTVKLLRACRKNGDGMRMEAYDDLQDAINILESDVTNGPALEGK